VDVPGALLLLLVLLLALGWALAWVLLRRWRAERSRARSQATRYGTLTEQYAPWLAGWPFADARRFRFLGDPIDGVQFEDDAVYLVEVKTAGATLNPRQRAVRDAVLAGRVGWVTFSVREGKAIEVQRPWDER
jgi:predicted Holliday junction resolvase-like endonuclease